MKSKRLIISISMLLVMCAGFAGAEGIKTDIVDVSNMFSKRDMRNSFIEDGGADILLTGESAVCDSSAVNVSGSTVTITNDGTYILSGELADGMIIVDADKSDKIRLVLNGASVTSETSAPIYIRQADKVFITLADGTSNALANGGRFRAIDENNIDAVIFSKDDLTLNGLGALSIYSPSGHGVVSKDDLVVTGGSYDITCSNHGLSGKDSVRVAGGSLVINSGKDGIHADNDEDGALGFVYIASGDIRISCGDDGIHAEGQVYISGGNIDISRSYEGIEGLNVLISGGNINIVSSNDGLNAAGGVDQSGFGARRGRDGFTANSDASITISGGRLIIDAEGDGIDSNGSLTVTGGEVYVSGPERNGNGAIDSASQPIITGGVFVAAGASGMAQGFGSSSEQGALFVAVGDQSANSAVTLKDESGRTLISWQSHKSFSSVVISCPDMVQGGVYTLTAGTYEKQITLDSLVYTQGGMGGFGRGGQGGRGGNRRGRGADWPDFDWDWPDFGDGQ